MRCTVSKYEALKALMQAEEKQQTRLVSDLIKVIRKAARTQAVSHDYTRYYSISESDCKLLEKANCKCTTTK